MGMLLACFPAILRSPPPGEDLPRRPLVKKRKEIRGRALCGIRLAAHLQRQALREERTRDVRARERERLFVIGGSSEQRARPVRLISHCYVICY